ncbi:MAG: zinc ribbon domain-containing protein [Promethearchaeota archaeon]
MKNSGKDIKKRGSIGVFVLIFIIITALSFILSLLINPIWWVLLPLSLLLLIVFQMTSHYFWLEKTTCPRCNAPTTKYSDFCRNCGLKLWYKCISCGKYLSSKSKFCDNCNIELEHTEEEKETFDYEIVKEGSTLPKINNFCSNCGAKLRNKENIKFCEECGEKL